MSLPDWADMKLYHYLAIGGGVFVLLALLLFVSRLSSLKVPAIVLGILGGFAAGVGLGVVGMGLLGYHPQPPQPEGEAQAGGPPNMPMPPGMPPGMGGGRGMPGGMGGGRGRGPNSKNQLANLVAKLDLLTNKPLSVKLDAKQKEEVRKHLKDLDAEKELTDEEAKKQLDALLDILKDQRKTLEDAGYRWPGGGGGGFGGRQQAPIPNPFAEGQNGHQHLESLRKRLAEIQT